MLLTFKIKLGLTEEQTVILNNLSNEARLLYNYFLNQKIEYYNTNKTSLSYFTQQKELKEYIKETKKDIAS